MMTWSRFEPGFTRHPKRVKCGPLASWLWVCSVDHCTGYKTDGVLEAASVVALVPGLSAGVLRKAVAALIAVGSWEPTDGGYLVHGYLEHNLSKEQVEENQAASKRRYDRWRSNNPNAVANGNTNAAANAVGNSAANAATAPLPTDLSLLRLGSKRNKVKDVDSAVAVTARASSPGNPGVESAPCVVEGEPLSRRQPARSGPAPVGDLLGETLERIKAKHAEPTEGAPR